MNVLFLMIAYPEMEKGSNLYTDLAEEFVARGHCVYVATALERKHGRETFCKEERGVSVLRIQCGDLFNVGFLRKGISTLTLSSRFIKAIRTYYHDTQFDLIIYPTPPITFASVAKYFKRRDKCSTYLILRDIFPQNARDLGMINNSLLYMYFKAKEKSLYRVSDYIGCMSPGNIDFIRRNNREVPESKLELLPNWKKVKPLREIKISDLKKKYGLENKIVAIYGGNIGLPQELDFLLELANLYVNREDIIFFIVGDGTEKNKIEKAVQVRKLHNVKILNYIPTADYENLVNECDIGLINLNRKFTIPNIPSKTLSYFEAEIPILAAVDKNTDYGEMLVAINAGLCSVTGDLVAYRSNFETLLNDVVLRKQLGKNGRFYLERHLGVETAYETIIKHFDSGQIEKALVQRL